MQSDYYTKAPYSPKAKFGISFHRSTNMYKFLDIFISCKWTNRLMDITAAADYTERLKADPMEIEIWSILYHRAQ